MTIDRRAVLMVPLAATAVLATRGADDRSITILTPWRLPNSAPERLLARFRGAPATLQLRNQRTRRSSTLVFFYRPD